MQRVVSFGSIEYGRAKRTVLEVQWSGFLPNRCQHHLRWCRRADALAVASLPLQPANFPLIPVCLCRSAEAGSVYDWFERTEGQPLAFHCFQVEVDCHWPIRPAQLPPDLLQPIAATNPVHCKSKQHLHVFVRSARKSHATRQSTYT